MEPLFSRPQDRDAAAAGRRRGQIHRRHAGHAGQLCQDVAAFLTWAAEPTLAERKKIGFRVMIFLIVLSALLYFTKKRIWADVH